MEKIEKLDLRTANLTSLAEKVNQVVDRLNELATVLDGQLEEEERALVHAHRAARRFEALLEEGAQVKDAAAAVQAGIRAAAAKRAELVNVKIAELQAADYHVKAIKRLDDHEERIVAVFLVEGPSGKEEEIEFSTAAPPRRLGKKGPTW